MKTSKLVPLLFWTLLLAPGCGSSDDEGLSSGGKGSGGKGGAAGGGGAAGSASGGGGSSAGGTGNGGTGNGGAGTGATGNGGTGNGGGGATSGGGGSGGGAPCGNDGTSWPSGSQQKECELINLLNQKRAAGATCGTKVMPAVPPVARNQTLTNNARAHSEDMNQNGYVSLVMKDGTGPGDWAMKGYSGSYITASVMGGQPAPSVVLAASMFEETECVKLMTSFGKGIGVGYVTDATGQSVHLWTIVVGSVP